MEAVFPKRLTSVRQDGPDAIVREIRIVVLNRISSPSSGQQLENELYG